MDGPSGAGKTTAADVLSAALRAAGEDVEVVHLDDIYPGWDGLAQTPSLLRDWVLDPMGRGQPARYRRYDWQRAQWADWVDVPPVDWLVCEGVGAGAQLCAAWLSALWWLEADEAVRHARGMARDGAGYGPHWSRWARQEVVHFAENRTRERADVVVNTTRR